jgi:glucoside 3-dehydrogenase (cytochrome c) hitch-hiker subunit
LLVWWPSLVRAADEHGLTALVLTDAYTPRNQQIFRDGMKRLEEACQREYGVPFVQARPEQRLALLQRLDAERQAKVEARRRGNVHVHQSRRPPPADAPVHYFRLMKELTLLGYFTSEIMPPATNDARRYPSAVPSPGAYERRDDRRCTRRVVPPLERRRSSVGSNVSALPALGARARREAP